MGGFFKRLFSRARGEAVAPLAPAGPADDIEEESLGTAKGVSATPVVSKYGSDTERAFQATCESRDRLWNVVGALEPDVISYLISPSFTGGPHWPTTRQAFRIVRRDGSVIVTTDGLADPFDDLDPPVNGFALELFVDTPSLSRDVAQAPGVDAFKTTWAFAVVEAVAGLVVDAGGIASDLAALGTITAELPGMSRHPSVAGQIPDRFITDEGSLGVIIGAPAKSIPKSFPDMPLTEARPISIVLLTASELAMVGGGGGEARTRVVEHLAATTGHLCDLGRSSAV